MTEPGRHASSARRVAGARIAGVVSCVPSRILTNAEFVRQFGEDSVRDVVKMIGVEQRHTTAGHETTGDLCCKAAQRLLEALGWLPAVIRAVVFVTQTPDYRLPATACTLQNRLGLTTDCAAFDVNLGCSGYVYGLWLAMMIAAQEPKSKVLLLVGDTVSKTVDDRDRATAMLFGDAGSATAIEWTGEGEAAQFVLGTDGAGARNLMIPEGAYRTDQTPDPRLDGRDSSRLFMDGAEIFNFTLGGVPALLDSLLESGACSREELDAVLFHQANAFMIRHLIKKMKLEPKRVPINIGRYGNTSSASLPLLMTSELSSSLRERTRRLALLGFGVGYSWGGAMLEIGPLACVETVIL